jgi:hypothetical protein
VSRFRTGSFIVKMILLNVSFLLMLWVAILEKPERVRALVVLLPIEILLNVVIVVGWRRFRSKVSTLMLIYICGNLCSDSSFSQSRLVDSLAYFAFVGPYLLVV